ncbi:Thyroid receptor-interacting protein 11 [Trichoplax sp. H2]|nr:Thyroid receptor-interacting protein 11 [Trichoplax sp. H2]|eukprot:RDD40166.1 Thyroid receptor-interacting protein 11 [Trichoplax sp. H2]
MAWFTGSFNNITDQISNFTKDVLVEGTQEIPDHLTELQIARNLITQLEADAQQHKEEYERLKRHQNEMEERSEAAELQISSISREYRQLLLEKENQLKSLKQQNEEMLEKQQLIDAALVDKASMEQQRQVTLNMPNTSTGLTFPETVDFTDIISCQREINRLSMEFSKMQVERDRWRHIADEEKKKSKPIADNADLEPLHNIIQACIIDEIIDLKSQLSKEIDDHNREMVALEQVHNERIRAVMQKHKEETNALNESRLDDAETIKLLKEQIQNSTQVESMIQSDSKTEESTHDNEGDLNESISEISKRLSRLQSNLKSMNTGDNIEVFEHLQRLQDGVQKVKRQRNLPQSQDSLDGEDINKDLVITDDINVSNNKRLQDNLTEITAKYEESLKCLEETKAQLEREKKASATTSKETEALKYKLKALNLKLTQYQDKSRKKIVALEEQIKGQNEQLESSRNKLSTEYTDTITQTSFTIEELMTTEKRLADANIQLEECKSELKNLKEQWSTLTTEYNEIEKVKQDYEDKTSNLNKLIQNITKERDKFQMASTKSEQQKRELEEKVEELTKMKDSLSMEILQNQQDHKLRDQSVEEKNQTYEKKILSLESQLLALTEERDSSLENKISSDQKHTHLLEELKSESRSLHEQLKISEDQLASEKVKNDELHLVMENLKAGNETLTDNIQSLQDQMLGLSSSASLSEEVLSNWELEKESLENALLDSRTKLKALKNANDALNQENRSLIANYEQLKVANRQVIEGNDEKEQLLMEIEHLREEIETLNSKLTEYEELKVNLTKSTDAKITELTEQLQGANINYSKISKEKDTLEMEILKKRNTIESLDNTKVQLEDEIQTLTDTLKASEDSNRQIAVEIDSLRSENAKLLSDAKANFKVSSESEELKEEVQNQRSTIKNLENEKVQLQSANQALTEEVRQAEIRNEGMQAQVKQLQLESQNHNSKLMEIKELHKNDYQQLVMQKDIEISKVKQERNNLVEEIERLQIERNDMAKRVNEIQQATFVNHENNSDATNENNQLKKKLQDLDDERNQLLQTVMERQREVSSLQSEVHKLTNIIGVDKDTISKLQSDSLKLQEDASIKQSTITQLEYVVKKYDNDISAMRIENEGLLNKLATNEQKHQTELERLRQHLVQIEESYTQEALKAKSTEEALYQQLSSAQAQMLNSTSLAQNNSRQAFLQIESLQKQLDAAVVQRDNALHQLMLTQEQLQQRELSLNNLQIVLEQFQRDQSSLNATELQLLEQQLKKMKRENEELQRKEKDARDQLEQTILTASKVEQLDAQLKTKDSIIRNLTNEVRRKESFLQEAKKHLKMMQTSNQARVDKILVKNMLVSYLTVSNNKKGDALKVLSNILELTDDEKSKVGLNAPNRSWVTSWLGFSSQPQEQSVQAAPNSDQSFTELFIKFLESESSSTIMENSTLPQTPTFGNPNPVDITPAIVSNESPSTPSKFLASLQQSTSSPLTVGNVNMATPAAGSTPNVNVNNPVSSNPLNSFNSVSGTPVKNLLASERPINISTLSQSSVPIIPQLLPFRSEVSTN